MEVCSAVLSGVCLHHCGSCHVPEELHPPFTGNDPEQSGKVGPSTCLHRNSLWFSLSLESEAYSCAVIRGCYVVCLKYV